MIDLDREAAFDAAGNDAGDDFAGIEGGLEPRPGPGALGLLARQARLAGAASSTESSATSTCSPALTSISPRSF